MLRTHQCHTCHIGNVHIHSACTLCGPILSLPTGIAATPGPGSSHPAAAPRYHDMLDAMDQAGIEPNATLHHFTHPQVISAGQWRHCFDTSWWLFTPVLRWFAITLEQLYRTLLPGWAEPHSIAQRSAALHGIHWEGQVMVLFGTRLHTLRTCMCTQWPLVRLVCCEGSWLSYPLRCARRGQGSQLRQQQARPPRCCSLT